MSGDVIRLVGAEMARLFGAVPEVEALTGTRVVVVGGLAVMCRLRRAYRATSDLDTVNRRADADRPLLEVLLSEAEPAGPAGVLLPTARGSVRVDVIEVPLQVRSLPEDPNDRLHLTAHVWAAETASPFVVEVGDDVAVSTRIAAPGPLVATKLQSVMNRPLAKERTDLLDIVRLVLDPAAGPQSLDQLAGAHPRLRADAAWHAERWFVERADATYRKLREAGADDVSRDTVALVADVLLRTLA